MKLFLNLAVIFSLIFVLSGCSTKGTRMMVSQKGSDTILVVDLDPTTVITAATVPIVPTLEPYESLSVNINPLVGIGYTNRFTVSTYKVYLESGQVEPQVGNSINDKSHFEITPNGALVVTAKGSDGIISTYNALTLEFISTFTLYNRTIIDIATCDDNKTILVTSSDDDSTIPTFYISRIGITGRGRLYPPNQEITYTGSNIGQIACAASSKTGAALDKSANKVISFTIDKTNGLNKADAKDVVVNGPPRPASNTFAPIPIALVFNPDGTELFVRITSGGTYAKQGWIEKFGFDNISGTITSGVMTPNNTPWLATAPHTMTSREAARISMHPEGGFIYIPDTDAGEISVINTVDGSTSSPIIDTTITAPTYISIGIATCLDLSGSGNC